MCQFTVRDDDGEGGQALVIGLIDSPSPWTSSEVTAALRTIDNVMTVLDCVEDCAAQTETVLRLALAKRVESCLFVNKVDRGSLELQLEAEHN